MATGNTKSLNTQNKRYFLNTEFTKSNKTIDITHNVIIF